MKNKKRITITNVFHKNFKKFNRKSNKIWADKGREFYKRSMKSWLQDNIIEMYSIHNEGKSVFAKIFVRALKNNINKYMTLI